MRTLLLASLFSGLAIAHIGSPDVFYEGKAGPYALFVTVRPPNVIPGVAEVEVRSSTPGIREVEVTPLPLTGEASKRLPAPDIAKRDDKDPQFFRGAVWLMVTGSWQVRLEVDGAEGQGRLSVPVPAVALGSKTMDLGLGVMLFILMLVLAFGVISIVGAAGREAQLTIGRTPDQRLEKRATRWMAVATVLVAGLLYLGNAWWKLEAGNYDRYIYKPLQMSAQVIGGALELTLRDPGWLRNRRIDDFIPDHNHLMHLYAMRLPQLDRVYHLHPGMRQPGEFTHKLPTMAPGRYALYADVVHQNGFPETMTADVEIPALPGRPFEGDDSGGPVAPIQSATTADTQPLDDGSHMIWQKDPAGYQAGKPALFRFRVENNQGLAADDMELYMGMQGHAAFIKHDRTVFAHVHPSGSVPMAALGLTAEVANDPHAGHHQGHALPAVVAFPYGFPTRGRYRILVQVKRGGKVHTAGFDTEVR
ncbi:MAG: hypothetical protein IT168_18190 [Bryobacterales bacterium]|nr:hypothetical protein [Bryobacterales bacterium]